MGVLVLSPSTTSSSSQTVTVISEGEVQGEKWACGYGGVNVVMWRRRGCESVSRDAAFLCATLSSRVEAVSPWHAVLADYILLAGTTF